MQTPSHNLVRMANQIGEFFASQHPGDADAAGLALVGHLKLFWAPPMRRQLLESVDDPQGARAQPIVEKALRRHGGLLLGAPARPAKPASQAFPEGGGDAG